MGVRMACTVASAVVSADLGTGLAVPDWHLVHKSLSDAFQCLKCSVYDVVKSMAQYAILFEPRSGVCRRRLDSLQCEFTRERAAALAPLFA